MKNSEAIEQVRKKFKRLEWLYEVVTCKENDNTISPRLAELFTDLVQRYAKRRSYYGYRYRDDMEAYAVMMLCQHWWRFNPEKSNNPFAYYSCCVHSAFAQFLNKEKREECIKEDYKNYLDDGTDFW